ncbi:MAG: carbohydrate kinase family protein [Candidatus Bathyarchaeia archaeon]|nr:carbohydrate kinase family protein [Candidatus Bathyarchaeota archaeon]
MFDVIGFGALNLDKVYMVNRIAGSGEESFITGYYESCGGSAANTVAALARLGLSTGYIGKVASDREGLLLLEDFRENRVNVNGVSIADEGRSGVVMAFVDPEGERALYVDPGVNDTLTIGDIDLEYASSAKLIHLTSFVGDEPLKAQIELLKELSGKITVSLDPGEIYARKGEAIRPLLERTDILILNEVETRILTGLGFRKGAERLLGLGPKIVVVKLGCRGCYATDGNQSLRMEALKARVVDTTGAGDAFNAGFIYATLKGLSLAMRLRLASFTASKCIGEAGARRGLPTREEVETILKEWRSGG